jgi:hypothetical protein
MNTLGNNTSAAGRTSQRPASGFASPLVELGQQGGDLSNPATKNQPDNLYNPFANALLNSDQSLSKQQQFEARQQEQKEILRRKLHDRVNPTSVYELFSSREQETKTELEKTRQELELLMSEFKEAAVEIDIALSNEIVAPGNDGGSYFRNFFHHLRQMIMLLRQRVSSARSWAKQGAIKSNKKKGLNFKKTKDVQSSINNERNAGANAVG